MHAAPVADFFNDIRQQRSFLVLPANCRSRRLCGRSSPTIRIQTSRTLRFGKVPEPVRALRLYRGHGQRRGDRQRLVVARLRLLPVTLCKGHIAKQASRPGFVPPLAPPLRRFDRAIPSIMRQVRFAGEEECPSELRQD